MPDYMETNGARGCPMLTVFCICFWQIVMCSAIGNYYCYAKNDKGVANRLYHVVVTGKIYLLQLF